MPSPAISRRNLLAAGISAAFLALVPFKVFGETLSQEEMLSAGAGAKKDLPFNEAITGNLTQGEIDGLTTFSRWAIAAWGFDGMLPYDDILKNDLSFKASETPSYLTEYQRASQLILSARQRFNNDNASFVHLMFADSQAATLQTYLGRARHFVYLEIVRHAVSKGGFRRFGFVNYEGNFGTPLLDPKAFRRANP